MMAILCEKYINKIIFFSSGIVYTIFKNTAQAGLGPDIRNTPTIDDATDADISRIALFRFFPRDSAGSDVLLRSNSTAVL